jgi:hypothetical protein
VGPRTGLVLTGIRSLLRPASSKSIYRLIYPRLCSLYDIYKKENNNIKIVNTDTVRGCVYRIVWFSVGAIVGRVEKFCVTHKKKGNLTIY